MGKKNYLNQEERASVIEHLRKVFQKKPHVLFAYLFGSFIKGDYFEDLDLAVYFREGKRSLVGGREVLSLEREIEEQVHFPVEIVVLNEAPLFFAFRLIKEGEIIFSRDDKSYLDFEERIRLQYFDFLPFYNRYYREVVLGQS